MSQKRTNPPKKSPEKNGPPPPIATPPAVPASAPDTRTAPLPFPIWQSSLQQRLGISIEELRELRDEHLLRGVDWDFDAAHHIVMTDAAAQKLAGLILPAVPEAPAVVLTEAAMASLDVPMTVRRSWPNIVNPRLVEAVLTGDGEQHKTGEVVCVRVRDNKQFRAGYTLTARYVSGVIYDLSSRPPKSRV